MAEGDSGSKTVTLTASLSAASTQTVTVQWATANGSASAGSDYTGGSGTLTFAPGDVSESFSVSVLGDDLDEGDESFTVSLSAPTNASLGSATSTVTITDDDTKPAVTTDPATGVTQSAATLAGTVNPNGKATSYHFEYGTTTALRHVDGDDGAGSGTSAAERIGGGLRAERRDDLPLPPRRDQRRPGRRTARTAAFTTGQPGLSIANASVAETNAPGSMTFTVTLSSASAQTVTVAYATAEGSATDPEDYAGTSGTLTFAPGVTSRTLAVPIVGDTLDENDETFTVTLSAPANATLADAQATGTIVDDDPLPGVRADDARSPRATRAPRRYSIPVKLLVPSGRA